MEVLEMHGRVVHYVVYSLNSTTHSREREREREERERCSCYFPLLGTETGTEYEITLLALGSRDHIPPQAFVFLSLLYLCLFLST